MTMSLGFKGFVVACLLSAATVNCLALKASDSSRLGVRAVYPVAPMSATEIASYEPYSLFSRAAFCNATSTATWTCANCAALPGFIPYASGGDGSGSPYWFVGYDPVRTSSVIVGHQGSDKISSYLIDFNFILVSLNSTLFPGLPSSVRVHTGFRDAHAQSASAILAAVKRALDATGATKVALVGHSLGGATALLDSVYLPLHLPQTVTFTSRLYGLPRVGNQAFANYVDANVTNVSHVHNKKDIVPILPPKLLGFAHPSGEKHIVNDTLSVACSGQDNTDTLCSTGAVPTILQGDSGDHVGPFWGVTMGEC